MIEVQDMIHLPGLAVPQDFYWVLKAPAPLAGMRLPFFNTPWEQLASLGFKHVVRLAKSAAPQDPKPLTVIHDVNLTDLVYGESPKDPVEEMKMIRAATHAVVTSLKAGKGVVVHCIGGTRQNGNGDWLCLACAWIRCS